MGQVDMIFIVNEQRAHSKATVGRNYVINITNLIHTSLSLTLH
jgi:hypothetical protein